MIEWLKSLFTRKAKNDGPSPSARTAGSGTERPKGKVKKKSSSGSKRNKLLSEAARQGDLEAVRSHLQNGADPNAYDADDEDCEMPLPIAAVYGHVRVVELLLANGADTGAKVLGKEGMTALQLACRDEEIQVIKLLLAKGADVNDQSDGVTPLHLACSDSKSQQFVVRDIASQQSRLSLVKLLVSKRANVNARDRYGETPLHRAATYGYDQIVEFLIANGADVNAMSKDGVPPLNKVDPKTHKRLVALLKKHGAKPKT